MTDTTTLEEPFLTIQRIIAQVAKTSPEAVVLANPVTGLTNVDSIVMLEIVARVELELGIEIDEEQLFAISTVGDFVDVCRELTAARA
ncbi:acyl carrier protein [Actinoplanes sp. NPDC026670]|uniref:acyl carrier protein n=1 Tax=Actinoplanes sp. NPDC026670 TaxID=3154700 RepID=UPI0034078694